MSTMILKTITLKSLGSVDFFTFDFAERLNVLNLKRCDELFLALRLVLNHKAIPPLPVDWVRAETRIEARISMKEKEYLVTAFSVGEEGRLRLNVYGDGDETVTSQYGSLSAHCAEQDLSDLFVGDEETALLRFLQYANEDLHYAPRELAKKTEGMSELKAFRAYLRAFIKNFKGERICEGKHYEIVMRENGRYAVRYSADGNLTTLLSESERTLFRYLCFLRTAEFWCGFEEVRNLHGIKKPLMIKDFWGHIDESVDVTQLLRRTADLGRQVIILS